jgi:hypothetical protein
MTSLVLSPIQAQVALPWVSRQTSLAEIRGTHHELLTYEVATSTGMLRSTSLFDFIWSYIARS